MWIEVTQEDDPADDTGDNYPEPNALRRFEALHAVARGGVAPPRGGQRPVVAGIFDGWWLIEDARFGLASVTLPLASRTSECLWVHLSAPPAGSGEFASDVVWIACTVMERLPGDRLVIRLGADARSEWGARDFIVTGAQVFESG